MINISIISYTMCTIGQNKIKNSSEKVADGTFHRPLFRQRATDFKERNRAIELIRILVKRYPGDNTVYLLSGVFA